MTMAFRALPATITTGRSGDVVAADWATDASKLPRDAALLDAVTLLRATPDVRMIAIVDAHDRPCGALLERDMRALLFSPFGHALLSNRGLSMGVAGKMLPCPTVEIGMPAFAALTAWRAIANAEGLILTRAGRFAGIVDQPRLLRIAAEQAGRTQAAERERAARIEHAALGFRERGRAMIDGLGEVSRHVDTASQRIADRAAVIDTRTGAVAIATGGAAMNLQAIAARAQDFAGALDAVEQRMRAAEEATCRAVTRTRSSAQQIAALTQAAEAIAAVSAQIDTIAQQTGMLALNAAIECARTGDAGLGFTAVAGEVKALATQTRTAARGIADHVAHIRTAIATVSGGHSGIADAVGAMEQLSASVIAAVRDQGAVGREIGANVAEASVAATEIEGNVADMLDRAQEAGDDAAAMRALAERLAALAAAAEAGITGFLGELDAPPRPADVAQEDLQSSATVLVADAGPARIRDHGQPR